MFLKNPYRHLILSLSLPALTHCYSGLDPAAADGATSDPSSGSSGASDPPNSSWGASAAADDGTTGSPPDAPADDAPAIDAYIRGLGHLPLMDEQPPVPIECQEEPCLEDDAGCVYTYYETTRHFAEFVAFTPNSAVLWPGAIVDGLSASTGLLTSITLPRDPLTFSVSLENLGGSPVGEMVSPSLSAFREARNAILAGGVTGKTAASIAFEMSQVFSAEGLSLALDTDVKWPGGSSVSAMFDFEKDSSTNKILVDFTQAYYTIDVDVPPAPSALFAPEVSLDEVQAFMAVGDPPMYVQSITFGRRVIFSIETHHEHEKIEAAFDAVLKAAVQGSIDVDISHRQVIDSLALKVFVLGGSGEDGVKAISGFEGLMEAITDGADFSAESPGAPIAYKLAYLDNAGTTFAYTTDYAEANCTDEMKVRVQGKQLIVHGNGEGAGKGEMKYRVAVKGAGAECVLLHQPDTKDTSDGEIIPILQSCDFVLPVDAPATLTVDLFAEELGGGLFDSDKQASNSFIFSYDPTLRAWSPNLPVATSLSATNDNLDVELQYAVELDG